MAKIRVRGDTSGYVDIAAPDVAGAATVNLDKIPQTDQVANFTSNVNVTGQVNATISSSENPAGYFRNTSGSGNSPALVARGGANNTTAPTFEVQDYNGNVDFKVDGNGYVTMPFQPAFRAGRTAGHVSSGTIVFNSVFTNIGNHYNSSTGLFTAPVAGRYYFHANLFSINDGSPYVQINKNGVKQIWILYTGGGYGSVNLSGVIDLATSDTVNVLVDQGSVYGAGGAEDCTFSGFLIG